MSGERAPYRQQLVVRGADSSGAVVLSNWPINFAGACILMRNDNDNPVTVMLQDSNDGTTWNLLTFSTPTAAGQLNIVLSELSFAAILFTTCRKYVRISVTAGAGLLTNAGVYCHICQWPPKGLECPDQS